MPCLRAGGQTVRAPPGSAASQDSSQHSVNWSRETPGYIRDSSFYSGYTRYRYQDTLSSDQYIQGWYPGRTLDTLDRDSMILTESNQQWIHQVELSVYRLPATLRTADPRADTPGRKTYILTVYGTGNSFFRGYTGEIP
jgi:hypothetical protein